MKAEYPVYITVSGFMSVFFRKLLVFNIVNFIKNFSRCEDRASHKQKDAKISVEQIYAVCKFNILLIKETQNKMQIC